MPSNQFEQKLRERLGGVELPPRPEVWTQLEGRLRREDRRGGLLWLFGDGVLAVLLLLSWFVLNEGETDRASLAFAPPEAHSTTTPFSHVAQEDTLACEDTETGGVQMALATLPTRHMMRQGPPLKVLQNPHVTQQTQGAYPGSAPETLQDAAVKQPLPPDLQAASDLQTREVSAAKTASGQVAHMAAPLIVDLSVPQVAPAVARKDIRLKNPSRWAWRFSLSPERTFGAGGNHPDNQPLLPSTGGFGNFFDNRTQSSSNVVYGNYLPPNDSAYYLIAYPENALTASVQAEYFLRPRLSIQSGLSLTVFDRGRYEEGVFARSTQTDPLTGIPIPNNQNPNVSAATAFHTLQAGVPLQLNYYLRRGMSSWVLSGGLSLAQQLSWGTSHSNQEKDFASDPGGPNPPASESEAGTFYARSLQSHATCRLLYERQLSAHTAWYIGPSFKYRLNNAPAGTLGQSPLRYRAGLEMGIRLGPGR